jgi:hypothetical protein
MIIRIRRRALRSAEIVLWILLVLSFGFLGLTIEGSDVLGLNISNQTVTARVNVTNTEPNLYKVVLTESPIDLNANGAKTVTCNGSFQDTNGYDDIDNVTATLFYEGTLSNAQDDNNTHYSNISCGPCDVVPNTGNQNGSCLCNFAVQYYANPGRWQCNMTINDSGGIVKSENTTFYTVNEVLGISVESNILDYGNMSVTQVSRPTRENVTNGGNIPINITLRGYGGDDEEIGRNYTMLCDFGANISFGFQRYTFDNSTAFGDMHNLTNQTRQFPGLTIPRRMNSTNFANSTNQTFWKLQIPSGVAGICNGTIIFGARDVSDS